MNVQWYGWILATFIGCGPADFAVNPSPTQPSAPSTTDSVSKNSVRKNSVRKGSARESPSSDVAIASFCGACHAFPQPSSFPRGSWREEVEQGFKIYRDSGRKDLVPTDVDATVKWFEERSPEQYSFANRDDLTSTNSRKVFTRSNNFPTCGG